MQTIAANPAVHWTGEWKKDYKTVRAVPAKRTAASSDAARWMQVGSLLAGDDGAADLRARLEALPATVRSAFPRIDGVSAVAFLTDAQIDAVADWPDVEWIEPQFRPRPFNDKAALTNMMNVAPAWAALSSGGLGLTGAGQIVAVADTGCDKGSLTDTNADFAGRIHAGYGWTNGNYEPSASWMDVSGHGTHVCGSVLGSGAASTNFYRGMAWEAELVVQGCGADLDGIPDDPLVMLKQAQLGGAYIHSDSWGDEEPDSRGDYIPFCASADGYMWTNQNFLMVIAAGNTGADADGDGVVDPGSVIPPGTAKNGLCVGAAENYRDLAPTWGGAAPDLYPAEPISSGPISTTNTPQGIAAFSGRGPTKDGRFKPDIVAPGTHVISVRSRATDGTGWGVVESNTNYIYEGGTSMSTPLTAGALALVRQWLVERKGIAEPSAALMKALLVNGARDMTPGQYGTGPTREITARPDRSQGFGHVNLFDSLEPGDGRFLHFATNTIAATYGDFTINLLVTATNAGPCRITLAWQDYPGKSSAAKALVNDLDLIVTSPTGTRFHPNALGAGDHANNIESVEFPAHETGTWTVRVYGNEIAQTAPHGGQPFALVLSGPQTAIVDEAPATPSGLAATGIAADSFTAVWSPVLAADAYDLDLAAPAPAAPAASYASLDGYPRTVGAATNVPVTGLAPSTDYAIRVRATNAVGASAWTDWLPVTTLPGDVPPDWTGIPSYTLDITVATRYELDLSSCVSGRPAPSIHLDWTSADPEEYLFEDGCLLFTPAHTDTYTFEFTASNALGTATATLRLRAQGSRPRLDFGFDPDETTFEIALGESVEFTVTATGTPTPVLSVACTNAVEDEEYTFYPDTGEFLFEPLAPGTYEFTFTASNAVGRHTGIVTVLVYPERITVPSLSVTNIADTSALAFWTHCIGVEKYLLQLATDDRFTTATGTATTTNLFSNPANSPTAPAGWTYDIDSDTSGYLVLRHGHSVVSAPVDTTACTSLVLSCSMRTHGGTDYPTLLVQYSTDGGATWLDAATTNTTKGTSWIYPTMTLPAAATGHAHLRLRFASTAPSGATAGIGIQALVLNGNIPSGGGSLRFDSFVERHTHTFTNLAPATTYFARVRGATEEWSPVVAFATASAASPYEQWLAAHGAAGHAATDIASNGHTYWENYLADIAPTATFLSISITDPSAGTFTIPAASTNRAYTLLYTTNLATGEYSEMRIGAGDPTTPIPFPAPGDWYGGLQVTLPTAP